MMVLSGREKAIAVISGAIAAFSIAQEQGAGQGASMYDYVLKTSPKEARGEIDASLIDEVFEYVASARAREENA